MIDDELKSKPGLFTAIGIGVGCMIGSGWLFAAYYAAKYVGPASYLSWLVGAALAMILALLLAEIASMLKQNALFARLLTISHNNNDFGFVIAISSWLGMVIVVPAEASATIQYLSTAIPHLTPYFFHHHQHTALGTGLVIVLVIVYTLLNFGGIKSMAKASNIIAILKIVIPLLTAVLLMSISFNTSNFTSQGVAPYGYGRVFSGVIVCGIFYAFYGFSMVAMFSSELERPRRNIPIALTASVLICLIIYLLLQMAFIASIPTEMIANGWNHINFTSPLAQLLILLNINILSLWAYVLYFDSIISPSGTGILYMGSCARTLKGMAKDKQMPVYFDKNHPQYQLSRRALIFTTLVCCTMVVFFKNWQTIMIVVSVFQVISCVAIPLSFVKLRTTKPNEERPFRVIFGLSLSFIVYMAMSYLLIQATIEALALALIMHLVFFIFYILSFYGKQLRNFYRSFGSSWTLFAYMAYALVIGYISHHHLLADWLQGILFILGFSVLYVFLLGQKNLNKNRYDENEDAIRMIGELSI
ncbi:APC family permease [Legionella sp. W05-934-2]|uniref:APC family permease n=1 Tax=Legionella sp. W05-934-2 TaxID=1198649 RepID=UPI003462A8D9